MVTLNKTWLVIFLAVIIASVLVLALYGKPFVNSEITEGLSSSAAAQQAGVSNTWIRIDTIISRISKATFGSGFLLSIYIEYLLKKIVSRKQFKKLFLFLKMCILIEFAAACGWCFLTLMSLLKMHSLPVSPFSEYLRVNFISSAFVTFASIGILIGEIALWVFIAKDNIYRIARDNNFQNYRALINRNEIEAAEEALIAATEMDKEGVVSWAVRALFYEAFLPTCNNAVRCLETAKENLKRAGKISDEDMATYEFCVGSILLNKNDIAEAIEHIKRSVDLDHNSEHEEILKKVQLLEHNE